jgi:hypothetical protein
MCQADCRSGRHKLICPAAGFRYQTLSFAILGLPTSLMQNGVSEFNKAPQTRRTPTHAEGEFLTLPAHRANAVTYNTRLYFSSKHPQAPSRRTKRAFVKKPGSSRDSYKAGWEVICAPAKLSVIDSYVNNSKRLTACDGLPHHHWWRPAP